MYSLGAFWHLLKVINVLLLPTSFQALWKSFHVLSSIILCIQSKLYVKWKCWYWMTLWWIHISCVLKKCFVKTSIYTDITLTVYSKQFFICSLLQSPFSCKLRFFKGLMYVTAWKPRQAAVFTWALLKHLYVKKLYCISIDLLKIFLISKLYLDICMLMVQKSCW